METAFFQIKKLTHVNHILIAAKHNLRENIAEIGAKAGDNIDPRRTKNNQILIGESNAAAIAYTAKDLMAQQKIEKLRSNAVRAVEIVFSLEPNTKTDIMSFFVAALIWTEKHFNAPILSAVVHLDEGAPHCHVLILPIVGGKMQGSALVGDKNTFASRRIDFCQHVANPYGLQMARPSKPLSKAVRQRLASQILTWLIENPEILSDANIFNALTKALSGDAEKLSETIGTYIKNSPEKQKAGVFSGEAKPIGISQMSVPIFSSGKTGINSKHWEMHSLSCVGNVSQAAPEPACTEATSEAAPATRPSQSGFAGDAPKTPSQALGGFSGGDAIDPPAPAQNIAQAAPEPACTEATSEAAPADEGDSYIREREVDFAANTWDFETGQFVGLPMRRGAS